MILLGRGGTILMAVGLALFLVSLIPTVGLSSFNSHTTLNPKTFTTSSVSYYGQVLTPQRGVRVTVTANGTVNVYLLEVSLKTLWDWLSDLNVTQIEDFLEANQSLIGLNETISEGTVEYIPTKVTNATLLFFNHNPDPIDLRYEVTIINLIAPQTKVQSIAQWTIPVGFVIAMPWLIQLWKEKTTRRIVAA
jgi:hypothetical protein